MKMTPKQRRLYDGLTRKQKVIFDSALESFPASKFDSLYDIAIQGGVKWDFKGRY
jgi:hypothetical protein